MNKHHWLIILMLALGVSLSHASQQQSAAVQQKNLVVTSYKQAIALVRCGRISAEVEKAITLFLEKNELGFKDKEELFNALQEKLTAIKKMQKISKIIGGAGGKRNPVVEFFLMASVAPVICYYLLALVGLSANTPGGLVFANLCILGAFMQFASCLPATFIYTSSVYHNHLVASLWGRNLTDIMNKEFELYCARLERMAAIVKPSTVVGTELVLTHSTMGDV